MHSFIRLFTADKPVVFALHGCQHLVHQMLHHRSHPGRFHVRGLNEQGTTTTPFAMVILNAMSRFHLAAEAIHRSPLKSAREESMKRLETMIADAVRSKPKKTGAPAQWFPAFTEAPLLLAVADAGSFSVFSHSRLDNLTLVGRATQVPP